VQQGCYWFTLSEFFAMQFGVYLVRQDIISAQDLVAAIDEQQQQRTPLGQLAIELGKLSARDVFRVLRYQADFAQGQFGEAAIELQLLEEADVAELLYHQSNRLPSIGEILVEQGAITQRQLEQELAAFRRDAERSGIRRTSTAVQQLEPAGAC
jgi:hypothetical protein